MDKTAIIETSNAVKIGLMPRTRPIAIPPKAVCAIPSPIIDSFRNIKKRPTSVVLSALSHGSPKGDPAIIKNIRIAKGGVDLYDKLLTDGKIVTTGIRFDVNKATIKPESMGVINEIAKLMKDHSDLKFSVEGHTDSDGDDASNQNLSEARASSVKNALVDLGIDASRLETKGFGESKPVSDNTTPEGKANNRRVEFVKI